jgi:hypothetical protein
MTQANGDNSDANGSDGLSDDDIEAALAGFEQDFNDSDDPTIAQMNEALQRNENKAASASSSIPSDAATSPDGVADGSRTDDSVASTDESLAESSDQSLEDFPEESLEESSEESSQSADGFSDDDFESDLADMSDMESALQQLLGEKASSAMLLTRVRDVDVLAAFAAICDIDAYCIADKTGAIAILKDLDGRHPEDAAQALTKLVNGMSVVLVVNRAGHIEAHQWINATQGESFPPPIVFMNSPALVEDVMVGQADVNDVVASGDFTVIDTKDLNKAKSFHILQNFADRINKRQHRRFGFGLRRRFPKNSPEDDAAGDFRDDDSRNGDGADDDANDN